MATTEKYSVVQKEGKREVKRRVNFYNLDAIISVGHIVNSKRGTQFRIWATNVLKEYLIKGYSVNEQRLSELKQTIQLLNRASQNNMLDDDETKGLFSVLTGFTLALDILDDYDHQRLTSDKTNELVLYTPYYEEAIQAIQLLRKNSVDHPYSVTKKAILLKVALQQSAKLSMERSL